MVKIMTSRDKIEGEVLDEFVQKICVKCSTHINGRICGGLWKCAKWSTNLEFKLIEAYNEIEKKDKVIEAAKKYTDNFNKYYHKFGGTKNSIINSLIDIRNAIDEYNKEVKE